jgi:hypothetical protein
MVKSARSYISRPDKFWPFRPPQNRTKVQGGRIAVSGRVIIYRSSNSYATVLIDLDLFSGSFSRGGEENSPQVVQNNPYLPSLRRGGVLPLPNARMTPAGVPTVQFRFDLAP